jgi:ribosomal-protein-alanine N-acetyltransferase
MRPDDIPDVMAVEQAAYTMPWPRKAYAYELKENKLAHYFVLRTYKQQLIGMGGIWLLADEAHIMTLAVHPHQQGHGLGEWLLIALLEAAQELGAKVATLEVRPSNQAARSLYQKYNFQEVGRRPRYYSDNREDALIMTTPELASPDYQAMLHQQKNKLLQRLAKIDADQTM